MHKDNVLSVYERINEIVPEEPISKRDLALSLMLYKSDIEMSTTNRITELIKDIIEKVWDKRFKNKQIEIIVIEDLLRFLSYLNFIHEKDMSKRLDQVLVEMKYNLLKNNTTLESMLIQPFESDIRIVCRWNDEQADVELHVLEPNGEKCFSLNNTTSNGGILSCDCVGLGPEEYMIRRAPPGLYTIKVKLFSRVFHKDPIIVNIMIFLNFSNFNAKENIHDKTVILRQEKEEIEVGTISVKN